MSANALNHNIHSSPPSGGTATHVVTPSTVPTVMTPEGDAPARRNGPVVPRLDLACTPFDPNRNGYRVVQALDDPNHFEFSPAAVNFLESPSPYVGPNSHPIPIPNRNDEDPSVGRGTFTVDDLTTRAFRVKGLANLGPQVYEVLANAYRKYQTLKDIDTSTLAKDDTFSVRFHRYDDALRALKFTTNEGLVCFKLHDKVIASEAGVNPDHVSNHAGEYLVHLTNLRNQDWAPIDINVIINTCTMIGDVKALQYVKTFHGVHTFRVEYCDNRVDAMSLNGLVINGHSFKVVSYEPDVDGESDRFRVPNVTAQQAGLQRILAHMNTFPLRQDPEPDTMGFPLRYDSEPIRLTQTTHNFVDINRIRLGYDVRTTIMLRNIPNRVDQATLKQLLDETSFGRYDFMYLRIDFANNCNVGYAFINFVGPNDIIPFVRARAGQRWNLFQSDKVAEVSYATIQGRDCLIQKFRNSSVMLEQASFRPKLYRTGNDPLAGTEEPFPEPDNQAKLRRSLDNAEHVGLYHPATSTALIPARGVGQVVAPPRNQAVGGAYAVPAPNRRARVLNAQVAQVDQVFNPHEPVDFFPSPNSLYAPREGQAYRERQRRQATQYDRGTPGAEIELERAYTHQRMNSGATMTPVTAPTTPYNVHHYLGRNFYNNNLA